MIKIFIVEDEWANVALLEHFLKDLPYDIDLLGNAPSVAQAVAAIQEKKPNLVFLDIRLQDGLGFQVLEQLQPSSFAVIFTTAYESYALRAFEYAAIHYILKPISQEAVEEAIARFLKLQNSESISPAIQFQQVPIVAQAIQHQRFSKIALPLQEGLLFVDLEDIVYCEADSNYTFFYLKTKEKILVAKSLRNYEDLLQPEGFFRIHDKYLINLRYVRRYLRGRGGQVELTENTMLDVAARRKDLFLQTLEHWFSG